MLQRRLGSHNNGFVVLLSVLIVSAIATAIVVSLLLLGIGASRSSFVLEQSKQAKALANTCAEDGLQRLADNTSYGGGDTITLGQGECEVIDVAGNGNRDREVQVEGRVGIVVRRVRVEVERINPNIEINRWEEVTAF